MENIVILNLDFPILSCCNICEQAHETKSCEVLKNIKNIADTPILTRARASLPKGLNVNNLSDGTTTVVSEILFEKGCQFGPLVAPKSQHVHPEAEFVFKLYDTNEYLDTSHEGLCNWMSLVSPATKSSEINLICYQMENSIFFSATKDINPGDELKIWYSPYYRTKLGIKPLSDSEETEKISDDLDLDLDEPINVRSCRYCGGFFDTDSKYARHLMTHFKPGTCPKPLISEAIYTQEDLEDDIDFLHIGQSEPPGRHRCDICAKSFTKPEYLRRHLRKHAGDFTCKRCRTKFGRKETMLMHLCPAIEPNMVVTNESVSPASYICSICNRTFLNQRHFERHRESHKEAVNKIRRTRNAKGKKLEGPRICHVCGETFKNQNTLRAHSLIHEERRFECHICSKRFHRNDNLAKHQSMHKQAQIQCQMCSKLLKTQHSLKIHMRSHSGSKQFPCNECPRAFHQKSHLIKHRKSTHPPKPKEPSPEPKDDTPAKQSRILVYVLESGAIALQEQNV